MWNSVESVTFDERIQRCEPLMKYLEDQILEQNRSVCLEGIFRPCVEIVSKSIHYKAAYALCRMLVEADLDFVKLHETFNESGLDQLELSLRTAFLHKMMGQSRTVVDQVTFNVLTIFLQDFQILFKSRQISSVKTYLADECCVLTNFFLQDYQIL